ncbi:hypothetical protein N7520_002858 [Penicillium odoratum]|uniref:uncharacterized protein n=1 Tax=Penicillium odoratum TaxID=1167516 RepID=UPI0025488989|nr:uncharacterized protein N7520_002858 [Penicillium odoratum]KAJ5772329.1 hypothetical protein N7520_002858 [Penicillium odoratum]
MFSMSSTSFACENTGFQLGNNHGTIGTINISSGRSENPQQRADNELLKSLAFPQMLDRKDNIGACHTNTCQWILELEEYQSWRNQPCGLLWIKGKPGAGKSTLMVFLHDRLKRLEDRSQGVIRLDFFFTARGAEMQRTPLGMLRSLLNQIFDRDETIRPQVREVYEQRCRQFGYGERNWDWPQVVLEELLANAVLASANHQHVNVFVDALDEAGAESAQLLADYFHRLVSEAKKKNLALQVCFSSRHYPIIGSIQATEISVEDHNQEDIALYVKDKLILTEVGNGFSQGMNEMLVKELTQHANGVFQWAHLIIPLIKQRILEGESINDILHWLHEVPAGLEDVYVYILKNVIAARNRHQSFLFFQWICLAERPLTVTEMRYALVAKNAQIPPSRMGWEKVHGFIESDENMKRRVKALAGGLAEVISSGDQNETIQVVHQSVNDFLRDKGLALLSHSTSTSATTTNMNIEDIVCECQSTLYRSCLVYLATVCSNREISDFKRSKDDLLQDQSFLNYATANLFIHAEKAAGSRADLIPNEKDILQEIINTWIWIYNRLDLYGTVSPNTGTTLLHMAAAANLVDIISSVLSDGENVEREDGIGNTALHLAARAGHTTAGKMLQERGANRERKNHHGATPLIEAASYGRLGFVEWLLDEGVQLEIRGGGALQAASLIGHNAIVEILLGAGADVHAHGGPYGNALQAAAHNGSAETVKILLEAGADVHAQGGQFSNALQAAAYRGSAEMVKILLDADADVHAQGGHYGNALQAAAQNGSAETVKILLEADADVHAQGGYYGNALQAAADSYNRSAETVKILLEAGADVHAQGGQFGNALQAAASRGSAETVKILLEAGADVHAQGGYYGNALQAAAHNGSAVTVKILLDADADVNCQGGRYGSPLLAAIFTGDAYTVQILLHAGADVLLSDELDQTPLHMAASRDVLNFVSQLTQPCSTINKYNNLCQTPLHLALYYGHINFAIKLLHLGADPSLSDGYGRHAMDWAFGHESLMREIRSHCPDLALTPYETRESITKLSLFHLSNALSSLRINFQWPVLQQLARYFLFLNETKNARHLFQLRVLQANRLATDSLRPYGYLLFLRTDVSFS